MPAKTIIINNEYKWRAIATIGIWIGTGIGVAFSGESILIIGATISTVLIWIC